jgi:putative nucleotidyltransferase with HDIG domain
METPDNVVRHCRAVGAVAETLAQALVPHLPAMDVTLARTGGLLHDMARLFPAHALAAQEVLANLGLPRLGAVVGEHMVLPPQRPAAATVTEHEIVYLADKLVADDELVGLDERQARALRKMGPDPGGTERIAARIADARVICRKIEGIVGLPLQEILLTLAPLP